MATKTVTATIAFNLDLWKHDDPVLTFPSDESRMLENGEHIIIEMVAEGDTYLARCGICGGTFTLQPEDPITVTPALEHWSTE